MNEINNNNSAERRAHKRINLNTVATLCSDDQPCLVKVCDISDGGVLVRLDALPSKKALSIMHMDSLDFSASVKIMWHQALEDGMFKVGLEFIQSFPLRTEMEYAPI